MTTESTEVPQGVMEILRKRCGHLVDKMLLAQFADATREAGEASNYADRTRMAAVASLHMSSFYDKLDGRWIGRDELVERSVAHRAAQWLSGLNAMRLTP